MENTDQHTHTQIKDAESKKIPTEIFIIDFFSVGSILIPVYGWMNAAILIYATKITRIKFNSNAVFWFLKS